MIRRLLILPTIAFAALTTQLAAAEAPVFKGDIAKTIEKLVPKGWELIAKAEGDLNGDGRADAVVAIQPSDIKDDEDGERFLIVAIRTAGAYRVLSTSDAAVLCKRCGGVFGDPFSEMTIKKRVIIIEHFGGSADKWSRTDRYRYQDGDVMHIGASRWEGRPVQGPEHSVDTNLLTGTVITKTRAEGCDDCWKRKKSKVAKKPLVPISDVQLQ